jgi:hypothetical protein
VEGATSSKSNRQYPLIIKGLPAPKRHTHSSLADSQFAEALVAVTQGARRPHRER